MNVWLFSDCWSCFSDGMVLSPTVRASSLWLVFITDENKVHGGTGFLGIPEIVSEEVLLLRSNMNNSVNE